MSNFQFVKNVYSWGMDIKDYVGSWITKDEYKQITGQDYNIETTIGA
ncbi:XkdX family protein [Limosilactobacillus reuteri]|nr:XkdX family protein [Limosilactobacillus reuteri]MCC4383676.1 XkdX family protein [Limosilactobacillus reuteri]MCC4421004.1 XkdX family protein [Limosilactobacillus reuteri]